MVIHKRNLKSGFTLIELLVVIAIIALLAAILFPVFGRARENARRSTCQSNLKQLGLGFHQYAQDYDEKLPSSVNGSYYGFGWAGRIYPYVKSTQVLTCPSDTTVPSAGNTITSYAYAESIPFSATLAGAFGVDGVLSAFSETSRTVMLFEISGCSTNATNTAWNTGGAAFGWGTANGAVYLDGGGTGNLATGPLGSFTVAKYTSFSATVTARHFDGANYLLADGHVKYLLPGAVSPGYAALNSANAVNYNGVGGNYGYAEGTQYSGTNKHAITWSPR